MKSIDSFYYKSQQSKDKFYLGMVSQVHGENAYVQVENLSLLNHRNIGLESLFPSTINYLVLIDSVRGLFIAQVYQAKVNSSDSVHNSMNNGLKDIVYPEIGINILGILYEDENKKINRFRLSGFQTVGLTDKVYIANKDVISIFIDSLEINENECQDSLENLMKVEEFDNKPISLKPNTLFDRHLMVVGTTNSGKSTSSLVILDKLISSKKKVIIIDPTGEYKESFNTEEVLKLTLGDDTSLKTDTLDIDFWINFFNLSDSENSNQASVLSEAIKSLRYQKSINQDTVLIKEGKNVSDILQQVDSVKSKSFDLDLLSEQIRREAVKQKIDRSQRVFKHDGNIFNAMLWLNQKVEYLLSTTFIKKFFKHSDCDLLEELDKFVKTTNTKSLYIDLSNISKTDRAGETVIDLIAKRLIDSKDSQNEDLQNEDLQKKSSFIFFIDEVHRYINKYKEDNGLVSIAREGRKKGIFLFLTTQSPKDVPKVLLGQIGTMIVHNLNSEDEIMAIKNKLDNKYIYRIHKLNRGEAILASINLIQDIPVYFDISKRNHNNKTKFI